MRPHRPHAGGEGEPPPPRDASGIRAALAALALAACAACAAPEEALRQMDEARPLISRGFADVVDAADRAFGEPRLEDRERIVSAKIGGSVTFRENRWPEPGVPLSVRLPLPALERRANAFLQFDSTTDKFGSLGEATSSFGSNKTLALSFLTRIADVVDTGARIDLFWHHGPHSGVRPFLRYERRLDQLRGRIEQQLYLNTDVGPGEKSILQVDRLIGEDAFVRVFTSMALEGGVEGVTHEYGLMYRRTIDEGEWVISAESGVKFNTYLGEPADREPGGQADPDEGYARLRIAGRFWRPWIEYEIAPGIFHPWRHEDPWEFGVTLSVRLLYEDYLRSGD